MDMTGNANLLIRLLIRPHMISSSENKAKQSGIAAPRGLYTR